MAMTNIIVGESTMESVVLYPYNDSYLPVIKYRSLIKDYEIKSIVTDSKWKEDKIQYYKNHYDIIVTENFELGIKGSDILWLIDDDQSLSNRANLLSKLARAIFLGKKILFGRYKDLLLRDFICDYFGQECLYSLEKIQLQYISPELQLQLLDMDVPIVFITGVTGNTEKYNILLGVYSEISKQGYNISAISARRDSEMMGIHSMPDFMWDKNIKISDKILEFNHFIKQIELKNTPELIIIEIPGGCIPYTHKVHNYFGEFIYIISNAIVSDYAILSSLNEKYDPNYFSNMEEIIESRYNIHLNSHYISCKALDVFDDNIANVEGKFLSVKEEFHSETIEQVKGINSTIYYSENFQEIAEEIISCLSR